MIKLEKLEHNLIKLFNGDLPLYKSYWIYYVLGNFSPNIESAQGIIEYAKLHDASEKGQVPFRDWPQEIKGHFRARLPVLGNN